MSIFNNPLGEFILCVVLGLLPSTLWLLYYLHKDVNPEPKKMVLKVFGYGFGFTFVAFGIEWALIQAILGLKIACPQCEYAVPRLLSSIGASSTITAISFAMLGLLAFTEEWIKFVATRFAIIRSRFFDEPIDAMIYLVIAALGFAAAENIGFIMQNTEQAVAIAYFRFISSTFLHTLASAILGYFFALSLIRTTRRHLYIIIGLILATALHTYFNYLIITAEQYEHAMALVILLMACSYFFVLYLFERVKKLSFEPTI